MVGYIKFWELPYSEIPIFLYIPSPNQSGENVQKDRNFTIVGFISEDGDEAKKRGEG